MYQMGNEELHQKGTFFSFVDDGDEEAQPRLVQLREPVLVRRLRLRFLNQLTLFLPKNHQQLNYDKYHSQNEQKTDAIISKRSHDQVASKETSSEVEEPP